MSESNVVSHTMEALGALYPSWYKASQDQSVRYAWGRAMSHAGLTMDQIKAGVVRAEQDTNTYPPSCGQFIEWCKPGDTLGKNMAFQMACMQSDTKPITDPLVLEAARRTGSWDLKNKPERETRPLFFEHYERVLRERDDGAQFRLPAPDPEPVETEKPAMSPEEQKRIMAELRGTLGVSQ